MVKGFAVLTESERATKRAGENAHQAELRAAYEQWRTSRSTTGKQQGETCHRGHNDWRWQANRAVGRPVRYCRPCRQVFAKGQYRRYPQIGVNRRRRATRNDPLIDTAKSAGCVDCGEKDLRCLDLDHVRGEKVQDVSRLRAYSEARLLAEIAKCEVRCANCHRKRTAERRSAVGGGAR